MTALYNVVCDKFEYVSVFDVLEICVHDVPPFIDDSHLTTEPPLPLNVNVAVAEFAQAVVTCGEIEPPLGAALTVTVTVVVFVHPFAPVPVTVYVVVVTGLAVTVAPTVDDKPVEGLQRYVDPPVAVNATLLPLQNDPGVGTEIVGKLFTVAVTASRVAAVHPVVVFRAAA